LGGQRGVEYEDEVLRKVKSFIGTNTKGDLGGRGNRNSYKTNRERLGKIRGS